MARRDQATSPRATGHPAHRGKCRARPLAHQPEATGFRLKLERTTLYAQVSIPGLKRLHSALHPAARLHAHANAGDAGTEPPATARDLLEALDEEATEEEEAPAERSVY